MAGDIKQKIVLEGEKEYNAALKEAQRNLKVLRSELKAETAELGKNATAQQKNEARVKNLQKQIQQQEKVVKTYEKALDEVRKRYGDNEDAIAKWEVKLNDARTALANMRAGLDDTSNGLKKIGDNAQMSVVAANSLAESFGKIANVGSTISGSIETAFSGIADTIKGTISAAWESIVDLAARSNNLVDLAGFWNTDVTTIQKYAGAVSEASATLEDLSSLVTKINSTDAKKITELVGVSDVGYTDKWEYAMAVMDAMSKMSTEQRNAAGFELFGGKQATKAFNLLNDWQTVLDNLDKYDASKGGYGLTEDQLQNMSDLYDKVNGLKQSWQSLKDMATVSLFGDLSMNITGNIQEIVDAFKDYFLAEDDAGREAALEKVKENIIEVFENIRDGIQAGLQVLTEVAGELESSGDPVLEALGKALNTIVSAFEWIADPANWEAVKTGFEAIIGIWAAGKIVTALGNMAEFVTSLNAIKMGKSAAETVMNNTAGGGGGLFAGLGEKLGAFFTSTLGKTAGGIGTFLYALLKPGTTQDSSWDAMQEDNKVDQAIVAATVTEANKQAAAESKAQEMAKQREAAEIYWDAWRKLETGWTDQNDSDYREALSKYVEAFTGQTDLFWKIDGLIEQLIQDNPETWTGIEDLPSDWWQSQEASNNQTNSTLTGLNKNMGGRGASVKAGVSAGISGIKVNLDGRAVGYMVAPYVSVINARDITPMTS